MICDDLMSRYAPFYFPSEAAVSEYYDVTVRDLKLRGFVPSYYWCVPRGGPVLFEMFKAEDDALLLSEVDDESFFCNTPESDLFMQRNFQPGPWAYHVCVPGERSCLGLSCPFYAPSSNACREFMAHGFCKCNNDDLDHLVVTAEGDWRIIIGKRAWIHADVVRF